MKFCEIFEPKGGELLEGFLWAEARKDGPCFALKGGQDLETVVSLRKSQPNESGTGTTTCGSALAVMAFTYTR